MPGKGLGGVPGVAAGGRDAALATRALTVSGVAAHSVPVIAMTSARVSPPMLAGHALAGPGGSGN